MKFRLSRFILPSALIAACILGLPQTVYAAILSLPPCIATGNCFSCDLVGLFVSIANFILLTISAVVIFAIAFGGFMWIYAAGNTEKVQKGIQIILGAITGLVFVLCGWVMVNVTIAAIMGQTDFTAVKIFGNDWEKLCRSGNSFAVVSSCSNQPDGTACSGGPCGDAAVCGCFQGTCYNGCAYNNHIVFNPDAEVNLQLSCASSCTNGATETGTSGFCPTGQVCCASYVTTP
ncbi:MAG: pilin [Candidatus Kerfeldbacteria bacterium]|nr:pilin [Candidatus Kerfeldbacteria bacterium]